ncbi:protein ABIL1-like [Vicia villosa]|uniref:protein ABIL1-like n=1 Tax=Vicia villosa TaxID=3911 RepID=UPI00273ADEB7|nr:protein ABIL1-like [Vicia villosa]
MRVFGNSSCWLLFLDITSTTFCQLDSVNKKVHFRAYKQTDAKQNSFKSRTRPQPSGTPVSKTLSWHLASETKSTLKRRSSHASKKIKDPKFSNKTTRVFHLICNVK